MFRKDFRQNLQTSLIIFCRITRAASSRASCGDSPSDCPRKFFSASNIATTYVGIGELTPTLFTDRGFYDFVTTLFYEVKSIILNPGLIEAQRQVKVLPMRPLGPSMPGASM